MAAALAAPYQIGTHTVTSGASIGVVSSQAGFATTDDYLRAADAAMYQAKSHSLGVCVLSEKGTEAIKPQNASPSTCLEFFQR